MLSGLVSPSFGAIYYYFNLNVVKFDKPVISLLAFIGFITLLIGTMIYNKYFKEKEVYL